MVITSPEFFLVPSLHNGTHLIDVIEGYQLDFIDGYIVVSNDETGSPAGFVMPRLTTLLSEVVGEVPSSQALSAYEDGRLHADMTHPSS